MTIAARTARRLRRVLDGLLVVLVLLVLGAVALGKLVPALGGTTFVVAGPSMGDAAPIGSAVVTFPVQPGDLAAGDIVSMQLGPQRAVFTHRVVRTVIRESEVWLETKGDANAEADPSLIPASALIGRVQLVLPFAGYLVALLSTVSGVAFLLGLGAILVAATWVLESLEMETEQAQLDRETEGEAALDAPTGLPMAWP